MKNVFKIVTIATCLTSLYQAKVAAAEDAILREQQEISNRVARMSEQNWRAYTDVQETPCKQKHSKREQNKKYGKQEAKGKDLEAEGNSHLTTGILGWYSSNSRLNLKYSEATQIQPHGNGFLYAYIDPAFTDRRWENALDRGFAARAKGQNGIKIFGSVVELKINAGQRLYTTRLYLNDQGDYIAILDQEGNHNEVSKKARKKTFEVKECASAPQQK
jgi:hypothetical protein